MFLGGRDVKIAFRGGLLCLWGLRADKFVYRLIFVPCLDLEVSGAEPGFAVNEQYLLFILILTWAVSMMVAAVLSGIEVNVIVRWLPEPLQDPPTPPAIGQKAIEVVFGELSVYCCDRIRALARYSSDSRLAVPCHLAQRQFHSCRGDARLISIPFVASVYLAINNPVNNHLCIQMLNTKMVSC
jgi:hypothetical protein